MKCFSSRVIKSQNFLVIKNYRKTKTVNFYHHCCCARAVECNQKLSDVKSLNRHDFLEKLEKLLITVLL